MALHISGIIANEHVRIEFLRDFKFCLKQFEYCHQLLQFLGIVTETLVIIFILCRGMQFLHNPMERSIASIEERSSGCESRREPLCASFIAARVISLGSQ